MGSIINRRFYFGRIARYYRRHGLRGTLRRFLVALRRTVLNNKTVLFYFDMSHADEVDPSLPNNCTVQIIRQYSEILSADLQIMFDHLGKERTQHDMRERFDKGAVLYVMKENQQMAAFIWSLRKRMVEPFFFPLAEDDVVVFDAESLPEYRGRGFYPLLVRWVLCRLRKEGASRVYMAAKVWNASSLRGLAKTPFRRFGMAQMVRVCGKTITIWYKDVPAHYA